MGDAMDDLRHSTVYSALPFDDSFRLLDLESSTDFTAPIVCRLRLSRLSDRPKYEALSYSWQSDEADAPPMPIRCNGYDMDIGSNLWHALRRLRRLRQTGSARVIWADALCVNQADTAERNHQVHQMESVYRGAHMVIIWLGELPPAEARVDIAAGLRAMLAMVERWLDDLRWRRMRRSVDKHKVIRSQIPIGELQVLGSSFRKLETAEARAVVHIFQRTWFRRLWVVQEVALARTARVWLGVYNMPWIKVGLAAQLLHAAPEIAGVVEDAKDTYRAIESARNIHDTWVLCDNPKQHVNFHDLLVLLRGMQCQDTRDRIFGLLAIPTSGRDGGECKMEADYTLDAGEVFRRVAVELLRTSDSLDLLGDCQHEQGTELGLYGPYLSWVPQWHMYPHMRLMFAGYDRALQRYRAAGAKRRELEWTANEDPRVKGVEVVRVKEVSRELTEDCFKRCDGFCQDSVFISTTSSTETGKGPSLPGSSTTVATYYDMGFWLLPMMAQTMSGLTWGGLETVEQYAAALKRGFLRWSFPDVLDKPAESLSGWERSLRQAFDSLETAGRSADEFVARAKRLCANRRLFLTEDGKVGLGPGVMRPGDVVCVLYGTRVPFVLRRIGDAYAVVGECYVDELMTGQAVGEGITKPSGEVAERWFELV